LNPKAALFTVSFVPQFVSLDVGPIWQQTMILGFLIVVVMILVDLPIVLASGKFTELIANKTGVADRLGKFIGLILLALAAYVAIARKPA
jgi:threonine/homoserine/homoserine lactone efflux protein